MTDATTLDPRTRLRRRVWLTGGILLVLWALAGLSTSPLAGNPWVTRVLFAAAAIVFALGWRGTGSVTARKPLGTVALILLGVWPSAVDLLWVFWQPVAYALLSSYTPLSFTWVVQLMLAVVVVMQIVRAGAVPAPWSWAPTIALATVVLAQVGMSLFSINTYDQYALTVAVGMVSFVQAGVVAALGVIAIVLGIYFDPRAEA